MHIVKHSIHNKEKDAFKHVMTQVEVVGQDPKPCWPGKSKGNMALYNTGKK